MTHIASCVMVAAVCVGGGHIVAAAQQPAAPPSAGISSRTTTAVTYEVRRTTKIDLNGTPLLPRARGEAEIRTEAAGPVRIKAKVRDVLTPAPFGREYLTYVLWAIPPQGRAKNLGELRIDDGSAEIEATSEVQTFALIVTAEPYYAVTTPSDVVVMETAVRQETRGRTSIVTLQCEIVPRGAYVASAGAGYAPPPPRKREPPDVQQARNAIAIAQIAQADRYAPQGLTTAQRMLSQVEQLVARRGGQREIVSQARASVQAAEEARLQAVGRRAADVQDAARTAAGSAAINEQPSEKRAGAVAECLTSQGLPHDRVATRWLGASEPVATNHTPEGRRQNRRVELVVGGEVIGTPIGASRR